MPNKSAHKTYKNSPITEAVFDICVQLPLNITLEDVEKYENLINKNYSNKKKSIAIGSTFQIKDSKVKAPKIEQKIRGFVFRNDIEKKVVQSRLDGFTYSKLKPYDRWAPFIKEAKELWQIYCKLVKPTKITRIALRYINEIKIPIPMDDFKDYILTIPEIAPELPQGLSEFFMRLTIPSYDIKATAIINETFKPIVNNKLPLIFDIDVFKNVDYNCNSVNIMKTFNDLRHFKNDVFQKSITKKTEELFV